MDVLVADWIEQARLLGLNAPRGNQSELEDSGRMLLASIADDVRETQSRAHRAAKGRGLRPGMRPRSLTRRKSMRMTDSRRGFH